MFRALKWLVAPIALGGAAVIGGSSKASGECTAMGKGLCTVAAAEGCRDGHEGVSAEEVAAWADKGWQEGDAFDSHIHVWGDGEGGFPYDNPPPDALKPVCDAEKFIASALKAGVTGALIVQPINYKFDHSYVTSVIKKYPKFFKGMALANPSIPAPQAESYLKTLKQDGYVALRFNPYLWTGSMADESGKAIYAKAGDLGMSVGVMCFKGLSQHMQDIRTLLDHSPKTQLIIDHWGFFRQPATGGQDPSTQISEEAWQDLLSLSKYPQVHVKLSALFRVSGDAPPYTDLAPRLSDLLEHYGAERLMWGSDYPYALANGGYCPSVETMRGWKLSDSQAVALGGKTAAKLFSAR